jgi:hypothetical protein
MVVSVLIQSMNVGGLVWSAAVLCSAAFVSRFCFEPDTAEKGETKAAEKHRRTPDQTDPHTAPTVELNEDTEFD